MTNAALAPLFFATARLRVDVAVFANPTVALWSLIIIAVASVTKLVGADIGARLAGLPGPEARALGVGLNARACVEIVIASIGLSLGILTDASYAAIVIMALTTSIVAPPLLRRTLRDWPGTESEQRRLAAEEAARRQVVLSERPPLLLTRGRPGSIAAAQFIQGCWPPHQPVVVATSVDRTQLAPVLNTFADRSLRVLEHRGEPDRLVAETHRGYGAVIMGVNETPDEPVLSELHRKVLASADTPIVIVRRERISDRPQPLLFTHALVPITGDHTSRAALELACGLAATRGTRLTLAHIVTAPTSIRSDHPTAWPRPIPPFAPPPTWPPSSGPAGDDDRPNRRQRRRRARRPCAGARDRHHRGRDDHPGGSPRAATAAFLLEHTPISVAVVATPPGWTRPPSARPRH